MNQQQKRRLGRGLAALIGDDVSEETLVNDIKALRHAADRGDQSQPQQSAAAISTMRSSTSWPQSLRDKGLLQPLLVRPAGRGRGL